jgi:hypothetical protein
MFDNITPTISRNPSEQTKKAVFDFLLGKTKGAWIKTSGNPSPSSPEPSSPSSGLGAVSSLGKEGGLFDLLRSKFNKNPQYRSPNTSMGPSNYSPSLQGLPRNYQLLVKNGVTRPHRNNNPLNIKESQYTRGYSGVVGRDPYPASDKGHFLIFDSVNSGFEAAKRLLSTEGYITKTVDAAMKRWSNNGYGGEILPSIKNKPMAMLTKAEFDMLVKTMARREGFKH